MKIPSEFHSMLKGIQQWIAVIEGAKEAAKLAEINVENTRFVAPVDSSLGDVAAKVGR